MARFSANITDDEYLSDEFVRDGGSYELPSDIPYRFLLVKDIQARRADDTPLTILKEFGRSLPSPYTLDESLVAGLVERNVGQADVLASLHHSIRNGVVCEGGLADTDEEAAAVVDRILGIGEKLEGVYGSFSSSDPSRSYSSWAYYHSEHCYLIVWEDRCAIFVMLGWD